MHFDAACTTRVHTVSNLQLYRIGKRTRSGCSAPLILSVRIKINTRDLLSITSATDSMVPGVQNEADACPTIDCVKRPCVLGRLQYWISCRCVRKGDFSEEDRRSATGNLEWIGSGLIAGTCVR